MRHCDAVIVSALGLLAKYVQFSWEFRLFKDAKFGKVKNCKCSGHKFKSSKALPAYSSAILKESCRNDETAMISFCTCFADGHVTSVTQSIFAARSCLCSLELS